MKFCIDCRYHVKDTWPECRHLKARMEYTDKVLGETYVTYHSCTMMRKDPCGDAGILWEPKVPLKTRIIQWFKKDTI